MRGLTLEQGLRNGGRQPIGLLRFSLVFVSHACRGPALVFDEVEASGYTAQEYQEPCAGFRTSRKWDRARKNELLTVH